EVEGGRAAAEEDTGRQLAAQLGRRRDERGEVAQPRPLADIAAGPAGEDRVVHDRVRRVGDARAGAPRAPAEQRVLAEVGAVDAAHALEAADALEQRAPGE